MITESGDGTEGAGYGAAAPRGPLRTLLPVLAALAACGSTPDEALPDCSAEVNPDVATALRVTWTNTLGGTSRVEFGETDALGASTPDTDAENVELDVIGMPADTDVHWRGVTNAADGSEATCEGVTRTGALPGEIPRLTVSVDDRDAQDAAGFLIGAFFNGAGGQGAKVRLAAYRRDGEPVWYHLGDAEASGMDLHYARDGSGILFNEFRGAMGGHDGQIVKLGLDGEELQRWDAPEMHHMFVELPDGTLTYQAVDIRSWTDPDTGEADDWVGDALVELRPDREPETVFSVWDVLPPTRNARMEAMSIYPGLDWTHGNMVRYDDATGEYLLSLGHADDLLFIDRATAAVRSVYGADGLPADPEFDYPHDVNVLPDGHLLLFRTDDTGAGAVEYAVTDAGLDEVWAGPEGIAPFALGQARRLANGNTYVNGGAGGALSEVTPDGTVVWEARSDDPGAIPAQFQFVTNLYTGE